MFKNRSQNTDTITKPASLKRVNFSDDAKPYSNPIDHVLDELSWLNKLLSAYIIRMRQANFFTSPKSFRDLFISDEEVDALLRAGVFEHATKSGDRNRDQEISKLLTSADKAREHINQRIQLSADRDQQLPRLIQLKQWFHLNQFELNALLICLAAALDGRYERLYAYMQNDMTRTLPSIDLIIGLLCQEGNERWSNLRFFHPSAFLFHFHLLESTQPDFAVSPARQFLSVDRRVIDFIFGTNAIDHRIANDLHFYEPLDLDKVVVDDSLKKRAQQLLEQGIRCSSEERPILYFHGQKGVGKRSLALALCNTLKIPLAVADMRSLLNDAEQFLDKIRLVLREGWLYACAICFEHLEQLDKTANEQILIYTTFVEAIQELGWLTILCSENELPQQILKLSNICPIEISRPQEGAQRSLWSKFLAAAKIDYASSDLGQLTSRFNLNGGQIAEVVRLAQQSATVQNPDKPQLTMSNLFCSCRFISQPKLSSLARKITPKYSWKHLVLPDDQLQQLKELVLQVKHRNTVMNDWGFAEKLSLGRGVNALFAGPSGTGKTMSAEIIADDLKLDLYKIDLSAVVSKYIGETEKNLNRIFTEAEYSNSILFFDEADALLGKRSEVKDAHDRYANIEISYLLQKMEEYEGITILATNLRQNIDDAFVRRIRLIIEFPFPEEAYRERIWRGIWPKGVQLSAQVDHKFLARQFRLSGGNIRNIALAAAFFAAENGRLVTMEHLIQATKREFRKMGKICGRAEFGEYYDLIR